MKIILAHHKLLNIGRIKKWRLMFFVSLFDLSSLNSTKNFLSFIMVCLDFAQGCQEQVSLFLGIFLLYIHEHLWVTGR